MSFSITAIKTDILKLHENIDLFIQRSLANTPLQEGDVLAITSKIVSLSEGHVVSTMNVEKKELVQRESDIYLGEIGYGCHLTVKEGLLIPSAGIDESNSEDGSYILYPLRPFESAKKIWVALKKHFGLTNLGVIVTDSHTTPLRKGVTGISLSHWGIRGVRNMIGEEDLFGRELKMTQVNVADALSVAAVFAMGEARECMPLAIIRGADVAYTTETDPLECRMPIREDLYYPLLSGFLNTSSQLEK